MVLAVTLIDTVFLTALMLIDAAPAALVTIGNQAGPSGQGKGLCLRLRTRMWPALHSVPPATAQHFGLNNGGRNVSSGFCLISILQFTPSYVSLADLLSGVVAFRSAQ